MAGTWWPPKIGRPRVATPRLSRWCAGIAVLTLLGVFLASETDHLTFHACALCVPVEQPDQHDPAMDLVGTWECTQDGEKRLLNYRPDGTFRYRFFGNGPELIDQGRYQFEGSTLIEQGERHGGRHRYSYGWTVSGSHLTFLSESAVFYRRVVCVGSWRQ